ncbi:HEAT repeat domain-containing protein [Gordonia amarae]
MTTGSPGTTIRWSPSWFDLDTGLTSTQGCGYRQYSEHDIQCLFHVEGLRMLGLTLQEIADALDGDAFAPKEMIDRLMARTRDTIARRQELLRRLDDVRSTDPGDWGDVLSTIALIRGLDDENPSTRQYSVLSAGSGDQHTVMLAEAALSEPDPHVAGALGWALARIGDQAVPVLAQALTGPSERSRRRAVEVLAKIDSPSATTALAGAVDVRKTKQTYDTRDQALVTDDDGTHVRH